jgi:hypothetical protein
MEMKKMRFTIVVVSMVFVMTFTACHTYQSIVTLEPGKTDNALGIGLSGISDESYDFDMGMGSSIIFFPDIGIGDIKWGLGYDFFVKFPFYFTKDYISVFPLFCVNYRYNEKVTEGSTSGIGINLGAGFEISIAPAFFIGGKVVYQPEFTSFMTSYPGFSYSLSLGYRTKSDPLRRIIKKITNNGLFEYEEYSKGNGLDIRYIGSENNVVVPEHIGGKKVVALRLPDDVTSVSIPSNLMKVPKKFERYYLISDKAKGTYSWEDDKCYFNGALLPEPAIVKGYNNLYYGGSSLKLLSINGKPADQYSLYADEWYVKPGTYNLEVSYFERTGPNSSRTGSAILQVVLEEGKTYELVYADASRLGEVLGLGVYRGSFGIREKK